MHPVERLRYVARASDDGSALYLQEAAGALASFADDPIALVTACRRLVDRQPANASIWWLTARVLAAADPETEAWASAEAGEDDSVGDVLTDLIPEGASVVILGWPDLTGSAIARRGDLQVRIVDVDSQGSSLARRLERRGFEVDLVPEQGLGSAVSESALVILEATCLGPSAFWSVPGARAAASVAYVEQRDVWVAAAQSHILPAPLFEAYGRRNVVAPSWLGEIELVSPAIASTVVTSLGVLDFAAAAASTSAPIVGELLR